MNIIKTFIFAGLFVLPLCLSAQTLPTMPPDGYDTENRYPAGKVQDISYHSSVTNSDRTMVVYTPPGYDPNQKYPVIYAFHGINTNPGTIFAGWCVGAGILSDNLLGEGKIEPVIIVAMDNNDVDTHRELFEVLIPYVESHYPVIADADHRGIYGYSWGGGVAFNEGLGNLNTFHHISPSSAAPDKAGDSDLFPNGGAEAKQKLKTLLISCGTADWMGLFSKSEDAHKYCVANNIPHHWLAVEGGNHDGGTWRPAMWNFLQLAFPADSRPGLTILTTGQGTVGRSPIGPSYDEGTSVTLTAQPQTGWAFNSWSGNGISGNQNPLTITIDSSKTITAIFNRTAVNDNMVLNNDFNSGSSEWTLNVWGGKASGSVTGGEYTISIDSIGTHKSDIQLVQPGLFLETGKTYEVTFDAYAASDRTLEVNVEMADSPWTSYLPELQQFNLTATKQTYTFKFTMTNPTDVNGRIGFNVGQSTENVTIDNVTLKVFDPSVVRTQAKTAQSKVMKVVCDKFALRIEFTESGTRPATLRIYNLKGNVVSTTKLLSKSGGFYSSEFDLSSISNGFYIVKICVGESILSTSRILLTK